MRKLELGCEYVLDLGNETKRFSSEQELDLFLKSKIENEGLVEIDKTFSINPKEKTKKILEECRISTKNASKTYKRITDEDYELIEYIPNSIGITEFVSKYGLDSDWTKPIIPGFDEKSWERTEIAKKTSEFKESGLSDEESLTKAQQVVKAVMDTWPDLTEIGTEVHNVIDETFKEKPHKKPSKLSESQVHDIEVQTRVFMDSLRNKHGKNCEFYTEFAIKSKELNSNLQTILEKQGINSLNGRIDLLVIDDWGRAHVYDFKVSRKLPGDWSETSNTVRKEHDWWHSTKIQNATYQQAFYNGILQQWGINVASCNIVPIKIDLTYKDAENKASIESINKISFERVENKISGTTSGKQFNNVLNMIPVASASLDSEQATKLYEIINSFFPSIIRSENVARNNRDANKLKEGPQQIWREVPASSPSRSKGRYVFKEKDLSGGNLVFADTKEDLFKKIDNYVEKVKSQNANELNSLADNINDILASDGNWEDIGKNMSESNRYWIQNQFKKYLVQKWKFMRDDELNRMGFFIFSDNAGHTEIVMITNKGVFDENKLALGKTLLGNTTEDLYVDKKRILTSSNGNIELMRAMVYISENSHLFEKDPITEIRCINPWWKQETTVSNSQLIDNYRQLLRNNPTANAKDVNSSLFWDDVSALIYNANSKLQLIGDGLVQEINPEIEFTQEWINSEISTLRKHHSELFDESKADYKNPLWQAYLYLQRAQLALNGVKTQNEINIGNWRYGLSPTGLNISSAQLSPSTNIRLFGEIHDQYVADVRMRIYKEGVEMRKAFEEFYKEMGQIRAIGGEANYFRNWFKQNPDGTLHKSFSLKSPDEIQGEKAKKCLSMFLDTVWKLRYPNATDETTEEAKLDPYSEYYQVPLTDAAITRQFKEYVREEGFFKGVWKSVKNKFREAANLTTGVLAEDEGSNLKHEFEITNAKLYNRFVIDSSTRELKISDHGTGRFETDLEAVFNQVLLEFTKQDVSRKYVPIFNAMRASLVYAQQHGGNEMNDVITAFDKMLKSKFYGEPIMDKNLQPVYRILSVFKQGFSTMTLGLSGRGFLREILQGMWTGASRAGVGSLDGVNLQTYIKGASHIIKEAYKNESNVSLLQQLNALYGMANYSLSNIPYMRKSNFLGIRNWSSDTLFLTASSPDFQHRMAILVAKMMGDGSWEAHSLDENGDLVYDMKKDKRFEAYIKGDESDPQYKYQKALYNAYLEEWNRIGYTKEGGSKLIDGDMLPQAYPPKEGQSIKNHADLLYGHYDDESRSLLNDMFLGSLFMQYKTYVTSKMEQWTMKPGVYNTEHLKQQYDQESGEELWVVTEYPEKDNTGIPSRKIVKKSEIKEDDIAEPYVTWQGDPMEGILQGMWAFTKALCSGDKEKLDELWHDPNKKAKLILGLHDMVFMSFIALLIKLLFAQMIGEDDVSKVARSIKDEGWLTQTSYNVLYGSVQDFPVWKTISSMALDLNPPMWGSIEKLVKSTTQVITGDKSLAYAVTQNVGALREFQGYVKTLDE